MTTGTSAETGTDQGTNTNQDTQVDSTQNSTDQSQGQNQQQTQDQPNDQAALGAGEKKDPAADKADPAADGAAGEDDGKGDGADPWAGSELDEETRKFIGTKSPAEVAKELMNAQKLLGKKAVGIPGKDSTPEEQRAFHKARGVPDDENGYDLAPAIDELKKSAPAGWNPSPEAEAAFKKAARLSNLSQGEASQFAQVWLGEQFKAQETMVAAQLKASTDAKAIMAKEWGPDQTVNEANFARGMKAIGLDGAGVDVLLEAVAGSGAARFNAVNSIAEIGRRFQEGGPTPGLGNGLGGGASMTKEQARAEMERIKADPVLSAAYLNPIDPRNKEVTAEMTRLGKIERGIS